MRRQESKGLAGRSCARFGNFYIIFMSRVGKKPIIIPEGVEVKIEGNKIFVKGPKGEISREVVPEVEVSQKEKKVFILPRKEGKKISALWGLTRGLIAGMIEGVSKGFEKQLRLEGLGFRVALEGDELVLQVGFTHPVRVKAKEGIIFSVEGNVITISGFDKEKVSQTAASIRKIRKPEPYKGTGILYIDEKIKRKAGKRLVSEGTKQ